MALEVWCIKYRSEGGVRMNVFWGLMIPFAGTALGAACVFFMKKDKEKRKKKKK